jgi:hypothetical protein
MNKNVTTIEVIKLLGKNDLMSLLDINLGEAAVIEARILELNNQTIGRNVGDALAETVLPSAITSFGASAKTKMTEFGSHNKPDVKAYQDER